MKNLILTVLVLFTGMTSFAGPRIVGNGGIAVEDDGKLYMLDLFERGIHKKPYYGKDIQKLKSVEKSMNDIFESTSMEDIPMDLLVYKISEIYSKNHELGLYIETAMENLDWRLVDAELVYSNDVTTPFKNLELRQAAIRIKNIVYVSSEQWKRLDDNNKIALLIHEAVYFFATPQKLEQSTQPTKGQAAYMYQSSAKTRGITGMVFTKKFSEQGFYGSKKYEIFANRTFLKSKTVAQGIFSLTYSLDGRRENLDMSVGTGYDFKTIEEAKTSFYKELEVQCLKAKELIPTYENEIEFSVATGVADRIYSTELDTYTLVNGDKQDYLKITSRNSKLKYKREDKILSKKDFISQCTTFGKDKIDSLLNQYNWKMQ